MLTGVTRHQSPIGTSAVVLTINAGSIFEVPGLRGVSHLVEHVVSTRKSRACRSNTNLRARTPRSSTVTSVRLVCKHGNSDL